MREKRVKLVGLASACDNCVPLIRMEGIKWAIE
jgi:hypothetical protein